MKKFNKIVKNDDVNVIVSPIVASEPIAEVKPVIVSELKTEISELEKIRNENKLLQDKLAEVSKKKAPGFQKTGKAGYDVVYDFLVSTMSTEGKLPESIDYSALTSLVRSELKSESYNNAKMESRYFGIMLSYIVKRFNLIEKPIAEVLPVIATEVKA